MNDFPLVRIQPFWVGEGPIASYSQTSLLHLVYGLDWLVFSDLDFTARTLPWFCQVKAVYELCLARTLALADEKAMFSPAVMNADGFYETTHLPGGISYRVATYAFAYDMECLLTHLLLGLFKERRACAKGQPPDIRAMRKRIWDHVGDNRPDELVQYRRIYQDDLQVTSAHRRVHRRTHPYTLRPASRAVIVHKHDALYRDTRVAVEEMRIPTGQKVADRISLDAMFSLFCRSLECKSGNPLAALLEPGFPRLRFLPIKGLWSLETHKETCGFDSAVEAFVFLRLKHPLLVKKGAVSLDFYNV